jgi:hypothetical protein
MTGAGHLYFWSEAIAGGVTLSALCAAGRLRRPAIVAGTLMIFASPLAIIHDGTYWTPARLFGGPLGIEDAMFSWRFTVIAILTAFWPWRRMGLVRSSPASPGEITVLVVVCGLGVAAAIWVAGWGVMPSFLVAQASAALILVVRHPDLANCTVRGAIALALVHGLHLVCAVELVPGFATMWVGSEPPLAVIAGIPIEEALWATAFGACAPAMWAVATGDRPPPASVTVDSVPPRG